MQARIKDTSRYIAMEVLERIEKNHSYSNIELDHQLKQSRLSLEDKALTSRLVYGVLQRKLTLDYYLSAYLSPKKKIENWLKQLLRLSAYQAIYLDRIPDHAIIDQAVEIAKKRGHLGVSKLVNAVLRNLQRHGLKNLSDIQDPLKRLSVRYSMPEPWLSLLIEDYGLEQAKKIAQSVLDEPYGSARVNLKYISQKEAIESLQAEGFQVQASPLTTWGIRSKAGQWTRSSLFQQGYITVQDESSMLVAEAMAIEEGHQVLDCCAAPGGKTSHIANYLSAEQGGHLLACDIHDHKIKLIKENIDRQAFSSLLSYKKMDAKQASKILEGQQFDRILLDAPCSGFGLLRRKPEIKYEKTIEDVNKLSQVQLELLNGVAPLLKPQSLLLYSTCTLFKKENDEVIQRFLAEHSNFQLASISLKRPGQDKVAINGPLQILPQDAQTDGFFICALMKE